MSERSRASGGSLLGVCAGRLGGETRSTAGQMVVRSARRVSDRFSWPRSGFGSGARARRERKLPRASRGKHQESRGECDLFRAASQRDRSFIQRLSPPCLAYARCRCCHQYRADFGISECRPPRGDVRPRTSDRHCVPAPRVRPPRGAPPEPRTAGCDAVPQSVGPGL